MAALECGECSVRSFTKESKKFDEVWFYHGFVKILDIVNDADARDGQVVQELAQEGEGCGNRGCGAIKRGEGGVVDALRRTWYMGVKIGEERMKEGIHRVAQKGIGANGLVLQIHV